MGFESVHTGENATAARVRVYSVSGAYDSGAVGTSIWETPSYDYSRGDAKGPVAEDAGPTVQPTVHEAFGAACVLDIWVDRIDLLDAMDGTGQLPDTAAAEPRDHPGTKSVRQKVTKFLAFVRDTLRLTVRELRSTGTYDELRRVNEAMASAIREEQQLQAELTNNREALNVLRSTIKENKRHYNVGNIILLSLE